MKKLLLLTISLVSLMADQHITLKVTGMTCPMCVGKVKGAVSSVDGVKDAKVYLKEGRAEITSDDKVQSQYLIDAIKKVGFNASVAH